MLVGTIRYFSGESTPFHNTSFPRKPLFRFVTSVVLGVAYGRRIRDLDDDIVRSNYKAILSECSEPFSGQHVQICSTDSSISTVSSGRYRIGTFDSLMIEPVVTE